VVAVGIISEDIDSGVSLRPAALPLGLPAELAEWVYKNQELIQHVQDALKDVHLNELTEEQIWHVIAAASGDPDFMKAQGEMLQARKAWDELNNPLNKPLGAIGRAFESDNAVAAHERYLSMLASYTIISEGLLQKRPDLGRLLNVLLVQKRMLDQSARRTREVREAAQHLGDMLSLRKIFGRAAKGPSFIQRQFVQAKRLIAPKKHFNATGVPVPWVPGI
jgi:hypothetical protein